MVWLVCPLPAFFVQGQAQTESESPFAAIQWHTVSDLFSTAISFQQWLLSAWAAISNGSYHQWQLSAMSAISMRSYQQGQLSAMAAIFNGSQGSRKWQAPQAALSVKMPSVGQIKFRKYGKICQNIYSFKLVWQCFVQVSHPWTMYMQLYHGLKLYINCPIVRQFLSNW